MATVSPSNSSEVVSPFPVHRFTLDQYRRLGQAGVLTEDDRVELLEGWIVTKMNLNPPHSATVQLTSDALREHLPSNWCLRVQDAITTADSEPEPDVAIVQGSQRDYADSHPQPGQIGVVIEIADTSLQRDRYKCRVYGQASIPGYWIIHLTDRRVEVYTTPTESDANPGYRHREDYEPGNQVPLVIDGETIAQLAVSDLLA